LRSETSARVAVLFIVRIVVLDIWRDGVTPGAANNNVVALCFAGDAVTAVTRIIAPAAVNRVFARIAVQRVAAFFTVDIAQNRVV
jgi:hypothetical protein